MSNITVFLKSQEKLTNEGGGLIILLQGFLYLYYTHEKIVWNA